MPEVPNEGQPVPEGQKFDITSEEQLSHFLVYQGTRRLSEEEGKAFAKQQIELAKARLKEKGGLTYFDRLDLGIIGKNEMPDNFGT